MQHTLDGNENMLYPLEPLNAKHLLSGGGHSGSGSEADMDGQDEFAIESVDGDAGGSNSKQPQLVPGSTTGKKDDRPDRRGRDFHPDHE